MIKLPGELSEKMSLFMTGIDAAHYEAIVRHCANIAKTNTYLGGGPGPLFAVGWNNANNADCDAILREFGLEP